jgi:hypothetical protein
LGILRPAIAIVAIAGLLAQGSTAGHMLLVKHTQCLEHGELVHGELDHRHSGDTAGSELPGLRNDEGAGTESGHDHCTHAAERRDALVEVAPTQCPMAFPDLATLRISMTTPCVGRSALLRFAPKNSPPA